MSGYNPSEGYPEMAPDEAPSNYDDLMFSARILGIPADKAMAMSPAQQQAMMQEAYRQYSQREEKNQQQGIGILRTPYTDIPLRKPYADIGVYDPDAPDRGPPETEQFRGFR